VLVHDRTATLACVMTSGGNDDDLLGRDPELADLVRTLRSYGVLTRTELLERSGARTWSDRGFDAALRRGVAGGAIKKLGDSLFEVGPDVPDLDEGQFDPT
jgi:hypothetical protein